MPSPRPTKAARTPRIVTPAWRRCVRWLGRVVRTLFVHQLRVRRVDGRLAVRLEDTPHGAQADATPAADGAPQELTCRELSALLDATPKSRAALRVLAAVEHGLKHKDPTGLFLFELAPARLQVALRQLDGLAPPQPTGGLAALRERIADASDAHSKRQRELEMLMPRSDLMQGHKLEIREARPSDFDRATEQWRTKDPAG